MTTFDEIRKREELAYIGDDKKRETAEQVVDVFKKYIDFETVIDLGCGTGVYLDEFKKRCKIAIGVDGNKDAKPDVLYDLGEKQDFIGYDLAFSIEVAEHIAPEKADNFADNLCCGEWIVMTTCPPDRSDSKYTKVAHLNEQHKPYWVNKMEKRGYKNEYLLQNRMQEDFKKINGIPTWFNHNLMVFRKCADF